MLLLLCTTTATIIYSPPPTPPLPPPSSSIITFTTTTTTTSAAAVVTAATTMLKKKIITVLLLPLSLFINYNPNKMIKNILLNTLNFTNTLYLTHNFDYKVFVICLYHNYEEQIRFIFQFILLVVTALHGFTMPNQER